MLKLLKSVKGHMMTELPISLLLVTSLTAVAMPRYANVIERARSAEALMALADTRRAMFFYFQEHGNYVGASLDRVYFNPNEGYDVETGLNSAEARQHFQ